ncbi:MAG: hypothetical protein Q4C66_07075 [Lachnospiraceae bacterium]|nr:hypothetical protein [Lachnospiraceae bacterium]
MKKVKFPLTLKDGAQVRILEELQENFDLEKIYEYFQNGKLLIWLQDRSYDEEADKIAQLSAEDKDFAQKICEIFSVPYRDEYKAADEKNKKREKKLEWLKEVTDDPELLAKAPRLIYCDKYRIVSFNETMDRVELCRISDLATVTLLENICFPSYIPVDGQSICFLTMTENTVSAVAVNIVFRTTKIVKEIMEEGTPVRIKNAIFEKRDGKVYLKYQKESSRADEYFVTEIIYTK